MNEQIKRLGEAKAPMEDQIRARCAELAEFLVAKNRAYGNSAADPVRVFSRADKLEQLRIRMDDKLSRIARGVGLETTDETVDDTKRDLAGYLVLEAVITGGAPWASVPVNMSDARIRTLFATVDGMVPGLLPKGAVSLDDMITGLGKAFASMEAALRARKPVDA